MGLEKDIQTGREQVLGALDSLKNEGNQSPNSFQLIERITEQTDYNQRLISYGAIYKAFDQLEKEGIIAKTPSYVQSLKDPEKQLTIHLYSLVDQSNPQ